ncbi:thiamine-phosphate kinase [Sphingomonas sp. PAMC 26617]|uniref:thiamine-phosphate kinase n=1 Tax=Sphingomonas sp. PAMC 26617 TaxID=1112216 RepID=UPI000288AC8E|nr:thiamine-phosphate kinase [Sphingomonas sp. PAMC 26617]
MTEAEFLACLRRLPLHPGALDLRDDAARLGDLVLTTDTLVEGVHYLGSDPAGDVAWKLVATNLSDLAAKGAVPVGVMLNYPLRADPSTSASSSSCASPAKAGAQSRDGDGGDQPDVTAAIDTGPRPSPGKREGREREGGREDWDSAFLEGFGHALTTFSAPLLGGDTVSLPAHAPRVLTLTAIGRSATAPIRTGARAGDALYVTGTIGDAGAGLKIAQGQTGPVELLAAYRRPQPRLAEGRALGSVVSAMMDVSDGLLIDAQRMAAASGLSATVDLADVPLSDAYRTYAGDDRAARLTAATAGDDYQLLFAAAPDVPLPCAATRVGRFSAGTGLILVHADEAVPLPGNLGFQHNQ